MELRYQTSALVLAAVVGLWSSASSSREETCTTILRLDSGPVCTSRILTNDDGVEFASFRAIPYAKQPLGELRFKELQPVEPWETILDASNNGPVCPQFDYIYEDYFGVKETSESCIHANIHVPTSALPASNHMQQMPLPILVFVHGGGFACGSGDDDVHGPENLMSKDVIVVTFNYRLNVFGFLSLNSSEIPGNNGIRDTITLLEWVQRNARRFGGDPDNVTIGGHSAGAALVHYLNVSPASQGRGLFKRAIAMSGPIIGGFFSNAPRYAQARANEFLALLNITTTDVTEIHQQLVELPLESIMDAHKTLVQMLGLAVFMPVRESVFEGVTQILDDSPENLVNQGRGKDIPFLFGYTTNEGEIFRPRLEELDFATAVQANSLLLVPYEIAYTRSTDVIQQVASLVEQRYFGGTVDYDKIVTWLTDFGFQYGTLKAASAVSEQGTAFIYEFNYNSDYNVIRILRNYTDAPHIEDLTYVFRPHSSLIDENQYSENDLQMMDWMSTVITNFMKCSTPTCEEESSSWPAVDRSDLKVQYIDTNTYHLRDIGTRLTSLLQFGDHIYSL